MADRNPKVGDPAIIDGQPSTIVGIHESPSGGADIVEFHDEQRQKAVALVEDMKKMEPEEAALARAKFTMEPLESGTRDWATVNQLFWVEFSSVWSAFGRLLEREPDKTTEVLDSDGNIVNTIYSSVRSRAKLRRQAGEPYDPSNEIAHHIIHEGAV